VKNLQRRYLSRRPDRGSILVISIWVLVFFAILNAGLYGIISSQIRLVRTIEERFFCVYLAESAVVYAQAAIIKDKTAYDTLYELGQPVEKELGAGRFSYTLTDEESKLNINTAQPEEIARLPGVDLQLAEAIVNSPLRPFRIKEEIFSVEGVDNELFDRLKDFITTHSKGNININTASIDVLYAAGLDEGLINIIDAFRKGPDNSVATEDDGKFEGSGDIVNTLSSYRALTAEQTKLLTGLINKGSIAVESKNFYLQLNAQFLDRQPIRYDIIVGSDKIEQWLEY